MEAFAALLKGVNLAGKRKLPMADLKEILAALGFGGVRTHLNSGNAIFSSDQEPARIEAGIAAAIEARLGMRLTVMVRTAAQLRAVERGNDLLQPGLDGSRMMALFLSAVPDPGALARHDPRQLDPDRIRVGDRVIYHWCPEGFSNAPPLSGFVEKHLGVAATARNWNTVTRLCELAGALP